MTIVIFPGIRRPSKRPRVSTSDLPAEERGKPGSGIYSSEGKAKYDMLGPLVSTDLNQAKAQDTPIVGRNWDYIPKPMKIPGENGNYTMIRAAYRPKEWHPYGCLISTYDGNNNIKFRGVRRIEGESARYGRFEAAHHYVRRRIGLQKELVSIVKEIHLDDRIEIHSFSTADSMLLRRGGYWERFRLYDFKSK